MSSWTSLPPFQVQRLTSVSRMDQLVDNVAFSGCHSHNGAAGQGASALGLYATGVCPMHVVPGHEYPVFPFLPDETGNWNRMAPCPGYKNGGVIKTDAGVSASGASIGWSVPVVPAGTCLLVYLVGFGNSNSGCISASIGGSPLLYGGLATYDMYTAASGELDITYDSLGAFPASGVTTLRLQVVGKNPSSGGYHAGVSHIVIGFT